MDMATIPLVFRWPPGQKVVVVPIPMAMVPLPMVFLWFSDGLPMISMASLPKSSFGFCSYAYGSY